MIRKILLAGDKRLKEVSVQVDPEFAEGNKKELEAIFQDLKDTVNARHDKVIGVGLAAVQIGVMKRIVVLNHLQFKDLIMVNPVMLEGTGRIKHDEMCLSFPRMFKRKTRKQYIKVAYLDEHFNYKEQVFTAMTAFVVQHELDHLDGITLEDG